MLTRQAIINTARQFLGVPWHHQGRSLAGIDCVGLIACVARILGIPHTDGQGYKREAKNGSLIEPIKQQLTEVQFPQAGTVVVFWFKESTREPQHLAIANGTGGIIHAHISLKRVVEIKRLTKAWSRRICGYYDFPGVD